MMPDNLSVWEAHECHEAKMEAWEQAHLPECGYCDGLIEDEDFLEIDGECYHRDCFLGRHIINKYDYLERFK